MVGFFTAGSSRRRHARSFGIAVLAFAAGSVRAEQVLVASLVDDITYSDIVSTGKCAEGCATEEHANAFIDGNVQTPTCNIQTVSPFDDAVAAPGLLRAHIYCEDSSGTLIEQGTRPCIFDVCVDFAWDAEESLLQYDVLITRDDKPSAPHTIYVDLSVSIDPLGNNTSIDSCQNQNKCPVLECDGTYPAKITMQDAQGDGWVGGVSGYYNVWQMYDATTGELKNRGTLAENHDSGETKLCLEDGSYVFNTTASAAFAEDMQWGVCDKYGLAGEGLTFDVVNGQCTNAVEIARATAEETDDASTSYCSLPAINLEDSRQTPCTMLSSGMKIDGVGLYYDDRCNSADLSGCGARSIAGCRLCFYDKELWLARFPFDRVPDWEECPCCVADTLGVECATGGGGGGNDEEVIIGVSVAIAGVIAVACCLSCAFGTTIVRFFRRLKKKKALEDSLDLGGELGTSAFPDSPTR